MDSNTEKLIEQLAQKLGTTSQYLWSVLVNQAKFDALTTLFQFAILAVVGYIILKVHRRLSALATDRYSTYGGNDAYGTLMTVVAIVYCLLLIVAFFSLDSVINGFFNPEYWALHKILNTIN